MFGAGHTFAFVRFGRIDLVEKAFAFLDRLVRICFASERISIDLLTRFLRKWIRFYRKCVSMRKREKTMHILAFGGGGPILSDSRARRLDALSDSSSRFRLLSGVVDELAERVRDGRFAVEYRVVSMTGMAGARPGLCIAGGGRKSSSNLGRSGSGRVCWLTIYDRNAGRGANCAAISLRLSLAFSSRSSPCRSSLSRSIFSLRPMRRWNCAILIAPSNDCS